MRKIFWIPIAVAGAAMVLAQSSAIQLLLNYGKTIGEAKTLKATYTIMPNGGAAETYDVCLSKPNMARIDSPKELIIADGTNVTIYDKSSKTYFKDPQTPESLKALFKGEAVALWAPFFDGKTFDKVSAKSLGTKTRKGVQLQAVEAGFSGGQKTVVYYLNDNLVRQAEVTYADAPGQKLIIDAKALDIAGALGSDAFAFKPPSDAHELTAEERNAGKWFENLDEALAEAKKTRKLVMLDFSAVW